MIENDRFWTRKYAHANDHGVRAERAFWIVMRNSNIFSKSYAWFTVTCTENLFARISLERSCICLNKNGSHSYETTTCQFFHVSMSRHHHVNEPCSMPHALQEIVPLVTQTFLLIMACYCRLWKVAANK
jgi:hypothetical protein